MNIGGDCNSPAVWVDGQLRVYSSTYPQNGSPGGVYAYRTGPTLDRLTNNLYVTPDRAQLLQNNAFGPWFESVIADAQGVLWAFYHAEFVITAVNKIHPRIGMQVSRDKGTTWQDLGIVIDTPTGSDQPASMLGYGFMGGNGDCSAILDQTGTYLYLFFSQYGANAGNQGVGVARMAWSERAAPQGKFQKWHAGLWSEPGLGGQATPLLANLGDAHGLRAPFDYWWGPSIHWNTQLQRYVILLNRSNTGGFSFDGGQANWFMIGASLDDPTLWGAPQPLVFPNNFSGSWYPQVIGNEPGETDHLASGVARLFVSGLSSWNISFSRQDTPVQTTPSLPQVSLSVGNGSDEMEINAGTTLAITGVATDANADMLEHWLEIRNSLGAWSWEGWLTGEPWAGALVGTRSRSEKTGSFTFTELGDYAIRSTADDPNGSWSISRTVIVHVKPAAVIAPERPRLQALVNGSHNATTIASGQEVSIVGIATDANGDMSEHWLEIQNPAGAWSWEGWLTGEPWAGMLGGNGFRSEKTGHLILTTPGTYVVRTTAIDSANAWCLSPTVTINVTRP